MFNHTSVLLHESVEALNIKPDGIYVDATMGGGGHSSLILEFLTTGRLIGFDQDEVAIKHNQEKFRNDDRVTIIKSNFKNLKSELDKIGITKIDGIIYDLGVSSMQIDESERGFSYMLDAQLDMRMDQSQALSAYDVVNTMSEKDLTKIFKDYGEEKFSKQIASAIVDKRTQAPITTTLELVEVIKGAIPKKFFYKLTSHPAKKVFQALRIYVNQELNVFKISVDDAFKLLNVGGRISVITFHSLEDRICKTTFKELSSVDPSLKDLPVIPQDLQAKGKVITNKPILPSKEELENNSRARSAKLRVIEKIKE